MPRPSSENWTTELAKITCLQRNWSFEITSWIERFPRPNGKWVTVKRDLFGIYDMLAFGGDPVQTIAIQYTDDSHRAARRKKIMESDWPTIHKAAGWRILLWTFSEAGKLHEEELYVD